MPNTYTYSVSADCPNGHVNPSKLTIAIENSSISQTLDYINEDGDVLDIIFVSALSGGEETTLDSPEMGVSP